MSAPESSQLQQNHYARFIIISRCHQLTRDAGELPSLSRTRAAVLRKWRLLVTRRRSASAAAATADSRLRMRCFRALCLKAEVGFLLRATSAAAVVPGSKDPTRVRFRSRLPSTGRIYGDQITLIRHRIIWV